MLGEADVAVDLNLGGGPHGYLVEGCAEREQMIFFLRQKKIPSAPGFAFQVLTVELFEFFLTSPMELFERKELPVA